MMDEITPEKAIKTLSIMQSAYGHIRRNNDEWDAMEIAKEACEKQVPKEIVGKCTAQDIFPLGECPECGADVCGDGYCLNCGQALKFGLATNEAKV
jgi:hypothetical protein